MITGPATAGAAPAPDLSRLVSECQPDVRSENTIAQYLAAYNDLDIQRASALTTEDFTRYSSTTAGPMEKAQWADMWVRFNRAFTDEHWDLVSVRNCGDTVALHVIETGTFQQPWIFPDGYVELPTGRAYRANSAIVFRLDESRKITSYTQFTTPDFLGVGLTAGAVAAIVRNGY
ncbi:hypothetical protein CH282_16210 [Rhodococcus sp. 06-418-1B]|nr:hypothetical protein CH282_16210 [Rhodococcus sp. 06-418-1B]